MITYIYTRLLCPQHLFRGKGLFKKYIFFNYPMQMSHLNKLKEFSQGLHRKLNVKSGMKTHLAAAPFH